jgi:hypothetical protein
MNRSLESEPTQLLLPLLVLLPKPTDKGRRYLNPHWQRLFEAGQDLTRALDDADRLFGGHHEALR